ncbi:MAG: hypothetical protein EOO46_20110 [Flavobacterium sp.]|nr:MAG: hypothetical protein EOO46_20110 [Flavobacterium sp.]
MFEIYQDAVFAFYRRQVENGLLSHLDQPSPGVLRSECLRANRNSPLSNEIVSLSTFFGVVNTDTEATNRLIENFDLDRLRPLRNFMIGDTQTPQRIIVEILAWLIDFEHRPYQPGRVEPPVIGGNGGLGPIVQELKFWQYPAFINAMVVLVFSFCGYLIWQFNFNTSSNAPKPNEKYMYWTGNHFEPIDSSQSSSYKIVETLDLKRMHGFKKIHFRDLLTKEDIGKVHLFGQKEKATYFTQDGAYPGEPTKKLRALSLHTLSNYSSIYRFILESIAVLLVSIMIVIVIIQAIYSFQKKKQNPLISR